MKADLVWFDLQRYWIALVVSFGGLAIAVIRRARKLKTDPPSEYSGALKIASESFWYLPVYVWGVTTLQLLAWVSGCRLGQSEAAFWRMVFSSTAVVGFSLAVLLILSIAAQRLASFQAMARHALSVVIPVPVIAGVAAVGATWGLWLVVACRFG